MQTPQDEITSTPCPTLGPTCRGCPDCQGIPPGIGIYETQAHADTDAARQFAKGPSFQAAATEMMIRACGDDPTDFGERLARFIEEAVEAGYQGGLSAEDLHAVVDYVTSKPRDEAPGYGDAFRTECGQALFTLANLASFARFSLERAGFDALRIADTPEKIARFRRKRAARAGRGALPGIDPKGGQ